MRCSHSCSSLAFLVLLLLAVPATAAEILLDSPFGDGMVIQRGVPVPVRGSAPGAEAVSVGFAGQTKRARVEPNGRFQVVLDPLKPGPPRSLRIRASNDMVRLLSDILVGDVWFCSGQSNMAWPVSRSRDAKREIAAADHETIRLVTVPRRPAVVPTALGRLNWVACSPKTVPGFSAVGYYFGREIQRKIRVPIGLIDSSYGGTPAEAWTRAEALTDDALRDRHRAMRKSGKAGAKQPSTLWNGMVTELVAFPVRGVIWYQGESNAQRAEQYRTLFPAMIRDWRDRWGQETMPFLFVQLANFGRNGPAAGGSAWAELRDAQLHTLRTVPRTGMAVTIDIGDPKNIHPVNKQDVGRRLALWAWKLSYEKDVVASGPLPDEHRIAGREFLVRFVHTGGGLRLRPGLSGTTGFTIAGEDRVFLPAKARVVGRTVVVSHPAVSRPKAVRYAWANSPLATLFNREGLPASPFRTDDWPAITAGRR
jgi:sialate O-acetylesterase